MKEHCRNIKCFQIDKSTVAAHSWENGHQINDNIKLIKHIIFRILNLANRWPSSENEIFNISSLSGPNTKNLFNYCHSRVQECMPL